MFLVVLMMSTGVDNEKMFTAKNFRLNPGHYATKYVLHISKRLFLIEDRHKAFDEES